MLKFIQKKNREKKNMRKDQKLKPKCPSSLRSLIACQDSLRRVFCNCYHTLRAWVAQWTAHPPPKNVQIEGREAEEEKEDENNRRRRKMRK
ncbi:hypothetical protein PoB_002959800 [Plakobranchus ocellatus]|uniref:Uncharacterized protein n=1 Tax=Plakobranchus ocellatus TaxID=259542 RepID=A0AAV4A8M1_9GAST|nr:hypothetical protein PoB_002959800 [Plakobranchus ocellatus]